MVAEIIHEDQNKVQLPGDESKIVPEVKLSWICDGSSFHHETVGKEDMRKNYSDTSETEQKQDGGSRQEKSICLRTVPIGYATRNSRLRNISPVPQRQQTTQSWLNGKSRQQTTTK